MKRKMITRTVVTTIATCIVPDMDTMQLTESEIKISGKYKDLDAVAKELRKRGYSILDVKKAVEEQKVLGIPEELFLELAEEVERK